MVEIKTLEERKNLLLEEGKKKNYITFEFLVETLKDLEVDNDTLDEIYNLLKRSDAHVNLIGMNEGSGDFSISDDVIIAS